MFIHKWLKTRCGSLTFAICAGVILYVLLSNIALIFDGFLTFLGFFSTVFMGIAIAYVMDPLAVFFQRRVFKKVERPNLNRILSVVVTIIIVLCFATFLFFSLIPQIGNSIVGFIENLSHYAAKLTAFVTKLDKEIEFDMSGILTALSEGLTQLGATLTSNIGTILNTSVTIGSTMINVAIAFILAIYFLLDKTRVISGCTKLTRLLISEDKYRHVAEFWKKCHQILTQYIVCNILDACFVGVANAIFMLIADLPYLILISVVVAVTNLAPTFGPFVGGALGAFILLLVDPWYALLFLIFTVILQLIDGYVIKPKLFGDSLGVPSIWILAAIIVGGKMFGVLGILLGIPFAAIITYLYNEFLLKKLEARQAQKQAAVLPKEDNALPAHELEKVTHELNAHEDEDKLPDSVTQGVSVSTDASSQTQAASSVTSRDA